MKMGFNDFPLGTEFDNFSFLEEQQSFKKVKVSLQVTHILDSTIHVYKDTFTDEELEEEIRKQIQFPKSMAWEEEKLIIKKIDQ